MKTSPLGNSLSTSRDLHTQSIGVWFITLKRLLQRQILNYKISTLFWKQVHKLTVSLFDMLSYQYGAMSAELWPLSLTREVKIVPYT